MFLLLRPLHLLFKLLLGNLFALNTLSDEKQKHPKILKMSAPENSGNGPMASSGDADEEPKRQSVVLQPMAGGIGLADYDDSDYDSEEEAQAPAPAPKQKAPATGGPNHRPMVGGFAAAAYEAARAHHYAQKKKGGAGDPAKK